MIEIILGAVITIGNLVFNADIFSNPIVGPITADLHILCLSIFVFARRWWLKWPALGLALGVAYVAGYLPGGTLMVLVILYLVRVIILKRNQAFNVR